MFHRAVLQVRRFVALLLVPVLLADSAKAFVLPVSSLQPRLAETSSLFAQEALISSLVQFLAAFHAAPKIEADHVNGQLLGARTLGGRSTPELNKDTETGLIIRTDGTIRKIPVTSAITSVVHVDLLEAWLRSALMNFTVKNPLVNHSDVVSRSHDISFHIYPTGAAEGHALAFMHPGLSVKAGISIDMWKGMLRARDKGATQNQIVPILEFILQHEIQHSPRPRGPNTYEFDLKDEEARLWMDLYLVRMGHFSKGTRGLLRSISEFKPLDDYISELERMAQQDPESWNDAIHAMAQRVVTPDNPYRTMPVASLPSPFETRTQPTRQYHSPVKGTPLALELMPGPGEIPPFSLMHAETVAEAARLHELGLIGLAGKIISAVKDVLGEDLDRDNILRVLPDVLRQNQEWNLSDETIGILLDRAKKVKLKAKDDPLNIIIKPTKDYADQQCGQTLAGVTKAIYVRTVDGVLRKFWVQEGSVRDALGLGEAFRGGDEIKIHSALLLNEEDAIATRKITWTLGIRDRHETGEDVLENTNKGVGVREKKVLYQPGAVPEGVTLADFSGATTVGVDVQGSPEAIEDLSADDGYAHVMAAFVPQDQVEKFRHVQLDPDDPVASFAQLREAAGGIKPKKIRVIVLNRDREEAKIKWLVKQGYQVSLISDGTLIPAIRAATQGELPGANGAEMTVIWTTSGAPEAQMGRVLNKAREKYGAINSMRLYPADFKILGGRWLKEDMDGNLKGTAVGLTQTQVARYVALRQRIEQEIRRLPGSATDAEIQEMLENKMDADQGGDPEVIQFNAELKGQGNFQWDELIRYQKLRPHDWQDIVMMKKILGTDSLDVEVDGAISFVTDNPGYQQSGIHQTEPGEVEVQTLRITYKNGIGREWITKTMGTTKDLASGMAFVADLHSAFQKEVVRRQAPLIRPLWITLVGLPTAGKDNQARRMSEALGIPVLSTGYLARTYGHKYPGVLEAVRSGRPVPDAIMNQLLSEELANNPDKYKNGAILNGYPRSIAQLEFSHSKNIVLDAVINFEISQRTYDERAGRRKRTDDSQEAMTEHWQVYMNLIVPMIGIIKKTMADRFFRVDAEDHGIVNKYESIRRVYDNQIQPVVDQLIRKRSEGIEGPVAKGLSGIVVGIQGAGKGTQAKRLAAYLRVPYLESSAILRKYPESLDYIHQALPVPDEIVLKAWEAELSQPENTKGFVLDGFPRTKEQLMWLQTFLSSRGLRIDFVLDLQVSVESATQRILRGPGRKLENGFPRTDDTPEGVAQRMSDFLTKTNPMIRMMEQVLGTRVILIDGEHGTPDEIFDRIQNVLGTEFGPSMSSPIPEAWRAQHPKIAWVADLLDEGIHALATVVVWVGNRLANAVRWAFGLPTIPFNLFDIKIKLAYGQGHSSTRAKYVANNPLAWSSMVIVLAAFLVWSAAGVAAPFFLASDIRHLASQISAGGMGLAAFHLVLGLLSWKMVVFYLRGARAGSNNVNDIATFKRFIQQRFFSGHSNAKVSFQNVLSAMA